MAIDNNGGPASAPMTMIQALRSAMDVMLERDGNVVAVSYTHLDEYKRQVVGLLPAVIVVVAVIVAVIMRMRRSMIVALAVRVRMAMIVVMPMVMSAGLGRGLGAAAGARLPRRGVIGMFVRCARHSGCLFVSR